MNLESTTEHGYRESEHATIEAMRDEMERLKARINRLEQIAIVLGTGHDVEAIKRYRMDAPLRAELWWHAMLAIAGIVIVILMGIAAADGFQ